ncbi:MAG: bifunctional adenosylcobinamide kinase/adenosylcobinamide-phosphate guanylyltransferase, partial [Muribaculaceae bacterium]|nr:bifunctional adenosylcobinamide kinase/adenosylcobinamide-phosphate guanylyltransferase [Muribaculaceae bacterium]
HKQRRANQWRNIESPLNITENEFQDSDVILLDCLTLWATNCFFEYNERVEEALGVMKRQIEAVISTGATFIMVTNEVGLGGVSANAIQRRFADLQGSLNQFVAEKAEDVYLIISGIPVKIK